MTVYGIVMALLLMFPWSLIGLMVVGAISTAVKRRLAPRHRAWATGLTTDASLQAPGPEKLEVSIRRTPAGEVRRPDHRRVLRRGGGGYRRRRLTAVTVKAFQATLARLASPAARGFGGNLQDHGRQRRRIHAVQWASRHSSWQNDVPVLKRLLGTPRRNRGGGCPVVHPCTPRPPLNNHSCSHTHRPGSRAAAGLVNGLFSRGWREVRTWHSLCTSLPAEETS